MDEHSPKMITNVIKALLTCIPAFLMSARLRHTTLHKIGTKKKQMRSSSDSTESTLHL